MEEDLQLILNVKKSNDEESLKELIERHSGIYVEMVNKYLPESLEGINKNDVLEDKNFCIYDAAIKFDENKKAKFSTYIGNLARWKCLNIYNKNIKFPQSSISEIYDQSVSCEPELKNIERQEELKNIFKIIDSSKDDRVKKIFKMRYKDGRKLTPWKKIAKKLDLSIQGCINIHNKHLTEIKKYV
jgi:RNA polymerase sigma factor (sigma-70 family)